jgi:hypothetical protein
MFQKLAKVWLRSEATRWRTGDWRLRGGILQEASREDIAEWIFDLAIECYLTTTDDPPLSRDRSQNESTGQQTSFLRGDNQAQLGLAPAIKFRAHI